MLHCIKQIRASTVTTSKALATTSDALVTSSDAAMHLFLAASSSANTSNAWGIIPKNDLSQANKHCFLL